MRGDRPAMSQFEECIHPFEPLFGHSELCVQRRKLSATSDGHLCGAKIVVRPNEVTREHRRVMELDLSVGLRIDSREAIRAHHSLNRLQPRITEGLSGGWRGTTRRVLG